MRFFVLTLFVLLLQYILGRYVKTISLCCWEDIVTMSMITLLLISKYDIKISLIYIFSLYTSYLWIIKKYAKLDQNEKTINISISKRLDSSYTTLFFNASVLYGLLVILFK